ncbi:MAG: hypothetical protein HN948_07645 [Clostridia bacterium]|jgi:hypothetical protein|nr:hypothetical protein [Clostridia bacterium]MBT7122868.1 hypothetical protein [Clostridia bacterium]
MKERYKRKQLSTVFGILITVGLVAAILLLHMLITAINEVLKVSFMEYIEYVLFILAGIAIVRKWITEYEYALVDDELFVDRYIGKRPRRLFETKLKQIIYIGDTLPSDYSGKKQRLTFAAKRKGVVYVVYIKDDDKKCVFFSPSEKMQDIIKERMAK